MAKLTWDEANYDTGLDRGVFFSPEGEAEAWSGLISVGEKPVTLRELIRYQDGVKILNRRAEDSFSATVTAFTIPSIYVDQKEFGFSYRTQSSRGPKIHLVYQARMKQPGTVRKYGDVSTFKFDISTRPVVVPDAKASARLIIDTEFAYPEALSNFEDMLYGTDELSPRLPSPSEVLGLFEDYALYKVIDNGDGTFTLEAPDNMIEMLTASLFEVDWPRVVYLDEHTYYLRNG